jgi:hemoglobin-like flavoprotein
MDNEIPQRLRMLMAEADESRQSNLLTGASAALRKTIYQLISLEKTVVLNENTQHTDYRASIHALRDKYPQVDPELFELLAGVQELASDLVHEDSWEAWDAKQLRLLSAIVYEILEEIYAEPARRKRRKEGLQDLRSKLTASKQVPKTTTD